MSAAGETPVRRWLVVAAFLPMTLCRLEAHAADKPIYAPPAAWVKPLPIPPTPASADGSAVQTLLWDSQTQLGPYGDAFYSEIAVKILKPEGLAQAANITEVWNPDTETLTFHRLNIIRDGKIIDQLKDGRSVTVLRRETGLELSALDGRLTATVQPETLRVGDILDIAVTLTRNDPVLNGHSEAIDSEQHAGVAARVHIRAVWPNTKAVRWRATEGLPHVAVMRTASATELEIDQTNVTSPQPPKGAPARFDDVGELELSDFETWTQVSRLMAPLYDKAARLAPDSALQAEVERIRRASTDPKARTEAALRLVQDQIRYVALTLNFGGYVPADADLTWSRRFGDCKGKTALLLALLHELGVEAEAALVSTGAGDGLDQRLPRLDLFDHVFVRASIGGKTYWLDGTRIGDRTLDDIPIPDFHWVLPVRHGPVALEKVEPAPYDVPHTESIERLDASAGLDTPAPVHLEAILRGDEGMAAHQALDALGRPEAERQLREGSHAANPPIDPKTVDFAYDERRRVMRVTIDGVARMDWVDNGGSRDFDIGESHLGYVPNFKREPGPHADAPYASPFPTYEKKTVEIVLPRNAAGFELAGAAPDIDKTIGAQHYFRHTRLEKGVVTMVAEARGLAPEFPYADAETVNDQLRDLARMDVVVRGPGAPEPLSGQELARSVTQADAPALTAQGMEAVTAHQYSAAISDFTRAIGVEPHVAKHFYDRGAVYYKIGDDARALADFDEAVRLDPNFVLALLARADLALAKGDLAAADKNFEAALKVAPGDARVLGRRAAGYEQAGYYEPAVRALDAAIALSPHSAALLNARCWARAEWGHELDAALADCDAALAASPKAAAIFDSRGFVHLRLGQLEEAIADYDQALALSPGLAPSLYGRGLASLRAGRKAEGAADIAAARRASPDIDSRFGRYGVKAPP